MDALRQWIHAGLDAIERARSGLHSAVDDLVEDGTITRDQAQAVLQAWKRTTAGEAGSESEQTSADRSLSDELLYRLQKVTPVSREDFDQLVARVEELEKRCGSG